MTTAHRFELHTPAKNDESPKHGDAMKLPAYEGTTSVAFKEHSDTFDHHFNDVIEKLGEANKKASDSDSIYSQVYAAALANSLQVISMLKRKEEVLSRVVLELLKRAELLDGKQ